MVDTCVVDEVGAKMWKTLWPGQLQTSWNQFSVECYKSLGEPLARERDTKYKCLQALLEQDQVVTLERFGFFSKWFYPFNKGVLGRVMETMKLPYFHGDISRKECEAFLSSFKKGSFLIRLSTTEPVNQSPFTISKVSGKGDINHQRIYVMDKQAGFYVHTKDKKKKLVNLEVEGPLNNLLKNKKVVKELGLSTACPGSKYMELFQKKKKSA